MSLVREFIQDFLAWYRTTDYEEARNQWEAFFCIPEQLGSLSGVRVAVIIDEFQDMKFYIHDVTQQRLDEMQASENWTPGIGGINLTATYDHQAQSRKAPMLVSGSAVTLIFRTAGSKRLSAAVSNRL